MKGGIGINMGSRHFIWFQLGINGNVACIKQ
jgi:hypothetical protein